MLNPCCKDYVVESLLRKLYCGIVVVDVDLWGICYGVFVVESLLRKLSCGTFVVDVILCFFVVEPLLLNH